jgi:hypothetical protein
MTATSPTHFSLSPARRNARVSALWSTLLTAISMTLTGLLLAQSPVAEAAQGQGIDLGDASVMSQQGQRLKIAVPYGSDVAEKFPLLRFEVQSVEAGEGQSAPSARGFTISKPENRNVIFLQSAETITAPNLKLVLAVAGSPGKLVAYDINVPPARATAAVQDTSRPVVKPGKRKAKAYGKIRRSGSKRR